MAEAGKQPSSSSKPASDGPEEVPISQLSFPQLKAFCERLEQDMKRLSYSSEQLTSVRNSFSASKNSVEMLSKLEDGAEIMVPLTHSLMIPGKLVSSKHVICDVGTGFHVRKSTEAGMEYMKRQIEFLDKNIHQVRLILQQQQSEFELASVYLQQKMQDPEVVRQLQEAAAQSGRR